VGVQIAEVRRLSQFAQLLAFWDPHLACHLADIDIEPELYAVQWVSTLFADSLDMEVVTERWAVPREIGGSLCAYVRVYV
jgi:hypothetical protein